MRSEPEGAMVEDRIYRCSDGHLYSAEPARASLLSVHLGLGRHWQRCPVDRHWRMANLVSPSDLTGEQLEQARQYQF